MPQLHVKKIWLYIFETYTNILQTSLKDSEWRENIHGVEEHEAGGDWEGGSLDQTHWSHCNSCN